MVAATAVALSMGASTAASMAAGRISPSRGDDRSTTSVSTAAVAAPPSFVTLLFSRTEVSAADRVPCVRDDRSVATLGGTVAPYLKSLGMSATGTIQTGTTRQSSVYCTHYGETAAMSWDGIGRLATNFGWHFVSHSATYPSDWSNLTPTQLQSETCGSAAAIDSHGLPGAHGLFAWPNNRYSDAIQRDYVSTCFAFGRQYSTTPTSQAFALTPPYYQHTKGINGGACNDPSLPCYSIVARGNSGHYNLPSSMITTMRNLKPGDWYTIQVYLLVTGKSPAYTTNDSAWDCTSTDSRQHWTNDNERYCWNDYQKILRAVPDGFVVTDPLTVAHEYGRPGY
jgi:hypothetical protein